jgi:cytochrome c oxidase subunit 2
MRRLLVGLAALVLAVGVGGSSSAARVVHGARAINVTARSFSFTPDAIQVMAGEKVTIVLTSTDAFHDFTVKGKHIVRANSGETKKGTLKLTKPGEYTFYCSVPGHRANGMKGTITVTRAPAPTTGGA